MAWHWQEQLGGNIPGFISTKGGNPYALQMVIRSQISENRCQKPDDKNGFMKHISWP
jgi:hypothetical protein